VTKGESITVTNVGSAAHTFTITGKGVDVVNNPGQSQKVTIDLAPGTYQFICRFHVSFGMKGTLTVSG
jgi:plastocyanin